MPRLLQTLAASAVFAASSSAFAAATLDERYSWSDMTIRAQDGGSLVEQTFGSGANFFDGDASQGLATVDPHTIEQTVSQGVVATTGLAARGSSFFSGGNGSSTFDSFTYQSDRLKLDIDISGTSGNSKRAGAFGISVVHFVFFTLDVEHDWSLTSFYQFSAADGSSSFSPNANQPSVSGNLQSTDGGGFYTEWYRDRSDGSPGSISLSGTLAPGSYRFATSAFVSDLLTTNTGTGEINYFGGQDGILTLLAIPEPASAALLTASGIVLLSRRQRR